MDQPNTFDSISATETNDLKDSNSKDASSKKQNPSQDTKHRTVDFSKFTSLNAKDEHNIPHYRIDLTGLPPSKQGLLLITEDMLPELARYIENHRGLYSLMLHADNPIPPLEAWIFDAQYEKARQKIPWLMIKGLPQQRPSELLQHSMMLWIKQYQEHGNTIPDTILIFDPFSPSSGVAPSNPINLLKKFEKLAQDDNSIPATGINDSQDSNSKDASSKKQNPSQNPEYHTTTLFDSLESIPSLENLTQREHDSNDNKPILTFIVKWAPLPEILLLLSVIVYFLIPGTPAALLSLLTLFYPQAFYAIVGTILGLTLSCGMTQKIFPQKLKLPPYFYLMIIMISFPLVLLYSFAVFPPTVLWSWMLAEIMILISIVTLLIRDNYAGMKTSDQCFQITMTQLLLNCILPSIFMIILNISLFNIRVFSQLIGGYTSPWFVVLLGLAAINTVLMLICGAVIYRKKATHSEANLSLSPKNKNYFSCSCPWTILKINKKTVQDPLSKPLNPQ